MQQPGQLPTHGKPQVEELTLPENLATVQRILTADPVWAAYAIADLQPAMAVDCRWLTAASAEDEALALIYSGLQPPILFTLGSSTALAELLAQADLPPAIYASIREEHLPAVARYYDLSGDTRPMWRMRLADVQCALENDDSPADDPVRLWGAQVPDVLRLLDHGGPFRPDAFSPSQMDQGVFYGLYDEHGLAAVGGTHVVDRTAGIAAIGNMYTRPDARRRGHSTAVLRAIVATLLGQGITTIVLNVDQRNAAAQAIYLAHGFVVHLPYVEGKGYRHA